jgi:spore germination protein YaaH
VALVAMQALTCALTSSSAAQRTQGRVLATSLASWEGKHGLDTVLAHSAMFRYVSPFSYQATSLTTFSASGGILDPAQRAALKAKGVAVVPTVTAGWGPADASLIFNTPAKRQAHVAAIVKLVTDNGFDGIDVDYEKMAYTTNPVVGQRLRNGFTTFARELCGQLRGMHKRCTITVMAKTADGHTLSGIDRWVWDYATLGRIASRVRVMAYDQHGPWGSPGPIADVSWVEDVVAYATSEIAPSKVELGVPLYGYNWSSKGTTSVQWDQASALRVAHNAPLVFDAASQSPMFTYRAGGIKHTVWFENARSLQAKVAVANRYHVGTIGFWYVGHQSPKVWPVLRHFNG